MTLKWPVLALLCLLLPAMSFAQSEIDPAQWESIESAIRGKKHLVDTYNQLNGIKAAALQQKDYNTYARARYCQLLITDQKSEDSLFLQNATFIDSILAEPHTPAALRLPMYIMLARRLETFKDKAMYQGARYYKSDIYKYTAFSTARLDSTIQQHYEQAIMLVTGIKDTSIEKHLWLSSNPLVFLYKPTLTDIIRAEQIAYNTHVSRFSNSWKDQFVQWLQLSPAGLINALDTIKSNDRNTVVLRLYSDWLTNHKKDTSAFFYLETLVRKYIFDQVHFYKKVEPGYEKYLQAQCESSIKEVRAHCVYQLCLLWNSRIKTNHLKEEKWPPVKALRLYESNKSLFDSFSYLGSILEEMKKKILVSEINWRMDQKVLPDEPILAQIEYKNVTNLYYRIIPVQRNEKEYARQDSTIINLLNKPFLRAVNETLPVTDDLDKHRTLLKIDAMPVGRYYILFSPKEITGYEREISKVWFNVTQIAIVTSGNRAYVLNRKNGKALVGAKAVIDYDESEKTTEHVIGREGYIPIKRYEDYEVNVYNGKDTAYDYDETVSDLTNKLFDKESEDLLEYYTDNASIQILADRSIYRPGQTVYYKGILMTKDPYTAKDIIVNKKNLQQGLFRNFLKKWLKEEKPMLYITDPFNKKVDSVPLKPNAFGSVTGSYRLPATAATGRWKIEGDIDELSWRSGSFQVEEYKRPTFELTEEKPVRAYMSGDTIAFTLKVHAFSGSTMANTKITYSIKRVILNNIEDELPEGLDYDSIVYTTENGLANIVVTDNAIRNASLPDSVKYSISYKLSATAVDLTGESHNLNTALVVSNRPVNIKMPFKEKYLIGDFKPLLITANDLNKVELSKDIRVKVYKEVERHISPLPSFAWEAEQWKYTKEQLAAWFPQYTFNREKWEKPQIVYETTVKTGSGEKLRIPAGILTAGVYTINAACYDNDILRGETKSGFTVYDTLSRFIPGDEPSCLHLPDKSFYAGDTVVMYAGSGFDSTCLYLQLQYHSRTKKKLQVTSLYTQQMIQAGVHLFKFRIPDDATDDAMITSFFIKDNEIYKHGEQIYISRLSNYPSIIIEQFRNKLTPGQQTTFSVSVKTKDHNVATELMSTMYDASLDRIQKHTWELPNFRTLNSLENEWPHDFKGLASGDSYLNMYPDGPVDNLSLWWMSHSVYVPARIWDPNWGADVMGDWNSLQGRVAGLDITQTAGLSDVVVVGYGTSRLASSVISVKTIKSDITIRGLNSLVGDNKPLVLLDGVPVNPDMSGVNVAEITEVMVLKDADATAIYGSRAANGVIIISTKGPIKLPEIKQEPVVKVRSNFNELAFFYPAVYADRDGYYRFTFTVPEALTEWNWKLYAHTKNAQFAYAERKLTTQLPFMIQPNMPRQLYQGDRLILKTRISNLDSLQRTGKTICRVEDAVTGEDITGVIVKNKENNFDVAAQSNTATAFTLNIPAGQLNPIKIVIKAIAGEFSDGEEHIIPVMTNKVLVKQAVPFSLTNHADTGISMPALNELYGIGVNIQPKPQGALINSLPFLANYSFDCAEQTFNKMLANVTALGIMRTDKQIQQIHTTIDAAVEKAGAPRLMPGLISEQAMPWLHLTSRSALQQKQLADLLDSGRTINGIYDHMDKLRSLQRKDGGLSWFEGGNSDQYITAYVVAGLGKMYSNPVGSVLINDQANTEFIYKLIKYLDGLAIVNDIFSVYARGYWKNIYAVADSLLAQRQQIIKQQWERVEIIDLHQQALLITTTMQWFDAKSDTYKKALQQLENIRQRAIEDPVNGIRWKELANENDLSISTEETLALLAEAFDKTDNATIINEGIIQWLLAAKTDHQWRSTKAAAAAIGILQKTQGTATGVTDIINTSINGKNIRVTNNLLSGEPFVFVTASKAPGTLTIKKEGNTMVHGSIVAWHFQSASGLNQYNTDIQLSKKLFIYNNVSKSWEPLSDARVLKVADKVQVVLTIETTTNLPYVFIDDKNGGAFEAVEQRSGYEYGNTISYYRSVRDAGMQIFASLIPAGRTEIRYDLKVTQEGTFTNGAACLQCMYKPEKAAYSNSILINTKE